MGRRSIEIKKIEDKKKRNVTFSKRRSGLFSKAKELSNRSGDQVGIIVFSESGKLYTFGQPGIDSILDRYLLEVGGSAVGGVGVDGVGTSADVPSDTESDDYEEDVDHDDDDVNSDDDHDADVNGNGLHDLLKASERVEAEGEMKPSGDSGMREILMKNKKPVLDNDYDDGVNSLEAELRRDSGGIRDFLMKKRSLDGNDNAERDHQFINPMETVMKPSDGGGADMGEICKNKKPVLLDNDNDDGVNDSEDESKRGGGIRNWLSSFDSNADNERDHPIIKPWEKFSLEEIEMLKKKRMKMTLPYAHRLISKDDKKKD